MPVSHGGTQMVLGNWTTRLGFRVSSRLDAITLSPCEAHLRQGSCHGNFDQGL
jgi:hypothetical protein